MNAATGEAAWKEVMPDVVKFAEQLPQDAEVLDIGCGMGRHTVYLAKNGFNVTAVDGSNEAVIATEKWLEDEGLHAVVTLEDFSDFKYPKEKFDGVLSINVIHHVYEKDVQRVIATIWGSMKPNGIFLCTAPRLAMSHHRKDGKQVESHTFIPTKGAEIGIPHFHFNEQKVEKMFSKFQVKKVEGKIPINKYDHYVIWATKIA